MLLLGLDAGTSVIKAALFGRDGRQRAAASRRTTVSHPHPAWSESDPETAWAATAAVIRQVLAEAGVDGSAVAAIGVTGAMVGAWVIDAEGRPLRPGILWDDGRSQPWIEARLARRSGVHVPHLRLVGLGHAAGLHPAGAALAAGP